MKQPCSAMFLSTHTRQNRTLFQFSQRFHLDSSTPHKEGMYEPLADSSTLIKSVPHCGRPALSLQSKGIYTQYCNNIHSQKSPV